MARAIDLLPLEKESFLCVRAHGRTVSVFMGARARCRWQLEATTQHLRGLPQAEQTLRSGTDKGYIFTQKQRYIRRVNQGTFGYIRVHAGTFGYIRKKTGERPEPVSQVFAPCGGTFGATT